MPRSRALAAVLTWLTSIAPSFALDAGRYGDVRLAIPPAAPRGYVVLFSNAGGWTPEDQGRLDAIAAAGALAVGVDSDAYLARVAAMDAKCDQLVGDTEGLSRTLQRDHAGAEYFFPILAGVGKGGALAGAILAQAPDATLGGAVALDPWIGVQTSHGFCPRVPGRAHEGEPQAPVLKEFWTVALTPAAAPATRAHFETLQESSPQLEVRSLSAPPPPELLASLIAPHFVADDFAGVAGLPLVDLPAASQSHLMAVFLSGDGGWRDIDRTIAENLQALGVSVVGWDSVRYFWRKKTPDQAAADLSAVILAYSSKWHADKVALIGFSFGADVLPFLYDRLRPTIQQSIKLISLLSLGKAADWEIRVIGWLGAAPSAEATPLGPALRPIPGNLIQCFYGDQDTGSYCPELIGHGAEVIKKKGIHHFDGNYVLMARQILDAFEGRIADGP